MLHTIPRVTPPLSVMVADIGGPHASALSRALGVSERTVYRWQATDDAPRPVLLSLYWLTQWGLSALDGHLVDTARLYCAYTAALRDENRALVAELDRVSAIAHWGSANDPTRHTRSSWRGVDVPLSMSPALDRVPHVGRRRITASCLLSTVCRPATGA